MGSTTQTSTSVVRRRFVRPVQSFNKSRPSNNLPKTQLFPLKTSFSHVPKPPKAAAFGSSNSRGLKRCSNNNNNNNSDSEIDSWFMWQDKKRAKIASSNVNCGGLKKLDHGFGLKKSIDGDLGQKRKRATSTCDDDYHISSSWSSTAAKLSSCDNSSAVTRAIQAAKLVSRYSEIIKSSQDTHLIRPSDDRPNNVQVQATAKDEIARAEDDLLQKQRQRQRDREAARHALNEMERNPTVEFEDTFQTMRELELLAGPKFIDFSVVINSFSGSVIKEEDILSTVGGPLVQTIEADEETSVEMRRYHDYYMKYQLPKDREAARLALCEIEKNVLVENNFETMRELHMLMHGSRCCHGRHCVL